MVRVFLASLIMAGFLVSASTGTCSSLDLAVTGDIVHVSPGSVVQVSATISNLDARLVFINGITSSLTPDYAQDDVFEPFETLGPDSLGPGESWEGPVLRLTISPTAPVSLQAFDLRLTGGDHPYDNQEIGQTYLAVDDSSAVTAVPSDDFATIQLRAMPNPFRGDLAISFVTRVADHYDVSVFDVAGRRVARLYSGNLAVGAHRFAWDGKNETHGRANRGVYFIRVSSGELRLKTKVLKLE